MVECNKEHEGTFNMTDEKIEEEMLYAHNCGRKSFQWELWQECNTCCSFCILGAGSKKTSRERKLKSLHDLKQAIEGLSFKEYNNISLMGGEFFQGQLKDAEIRERFFEIVELCGNLYANKKIGSMWVTATLNIGQQEDLYETLSTLEKAGLKPHPEYPSSGLWICTSWDKKGRFRTEEREKNWQKHMKQIKQKFPWVKLNTSIILTQEVCEMYLRGEFAPREFMNNFDTQLVLNVPRIFDLGTDAYQSLQLHSRLSETGEMNEKVKEYKKQIEADLGFRFFPDRKTFRKFLLKFAKDDPELFHLSLFNIERTSNETHKNFNAQQECIVNERDENNNTEACSFADVVPNINCLIEDVNCKHSIAYEGYIDCCDCMMCDREQIKRCTNIK